MSDPFIPLLIIHPPSSDFPSDVLKWMKINAKPKMALKLMQCHKYFQHPEFPYSIIEDVEYYFDGYEQYFSALDAEYLNDDELFESIKNITKNLWITHGISLIEVPTSIISCLIPKIAVCDISKLDLVNQQLSINEFKFLTASGRIKVLDFYNTSVKNENGEPVFVDEYFEFLPNVKDFVV
uniref:Uncharacterized protein n=1 Tax=Panagrolaimus sp. ES5 TaxID=591445 RepID=A0AC34F6N0_9BILA